MDLQAKWANVFHLRDGKVIRLLLYYDRDRALADLGLALEGACSSRRSLPRWWDLKRARRPSALTGSVMDIDAGLAERHGGRETDRFRGQVA